MSDLRRDYFLTRLLNAQPDNAERLEAVFAEVDSRCARPVRGGGYRGGAGHLPPSRQPALREPGARRRDRAPERRIGASEVEDDRALLPRLLRARVHLPARRAGRVRRRPSRRDRGGRQARAREAAGHRQAAYSRTPSRARAPSTSRRRAFSGRRSTTATCSSPACVRRAGDRRDRRARPTSSIRRTGRRSTTSATCHLARGRPADGLGRAPSRSRSRSSRARCRRRATRCSPRSARRR